MASRGFTLIELLVVLAIMALIFSLSIPLITNAFPGAELKAAAREIATGLRQARSQAITRNREVGFTLDVERGLYRIGGDGELQELPAKLEIELITARSLRLDEATGTIRFFPDGGATGGGIRLAHGERDYHVMVDWLTGRISILD